MADRLEGIPRRLTRTVVRSSAAPVEEIGQDGGHGLDVGVGLAATAVVLDDQRPRRGRLEARQRLEPLDVGDVATEGSGVDFEQLGG